MEEEEDIVFVCSAAHPFAKKSSLKLSELLSEPFLLTEKNASYRFVLDRYLAALGRSIEPFLEIGNTEFIIRLLKENHGLSFLPRFAVENELTAGNTFHPPGGRLPYENLPSAFLPSGQMGHQGNGSLYFPGKGDRRTSLPAAQTVRNTKRISPSADADGKTIAAGPVIKAAEPRIERGGDQRSNHGYAGKGRAISVPLPEQAAEKRQKNRREWHRNPINTSPRHDHRGRVKKQEHMTGKRR